MKDKKKTNKGITLIALVITIIVLLILAGVSIAMLTGKNGILIQAEMAKEETIVGEEKEQIALSYNTAKIKKVSNNKEQELNENDLKSQLVDEDKQDVSIASDNELIIVKYNETRNMYSIDKLGNISGPLEQINDEYAGDITKNATRTGDSEESAYIINCIEDLVGLSARVNQGDNFQNKYIQLNRTLDFKSVSSYNNAFEKYSYDSENLMYKKDETSTTSIKYLLNNDLGFIPIGKDSTNCFAGTFNGYGNEIKNLYIDNEELDDVGLFGYSIGTIKKIGMVNSNIVGKSNVGSICGLLCKSTGLIQYCYNVNGTISGESNAGGIVGGISLPNADASTRGSRVYNCYNTGKVVSEYNAGGIVGQGRICISY